ncbi:hypothetical protein [Burkholderia ubonensis]|uniref:hypothetical protein n=1 Tax=Burkholderia ubonensis TaxID=101571 RepID=UPI000ABD435B|nr:hypothetical protein [Burkholderia ubonensis]
MNGKPLLKQAGSPPGAGGRQIRPTFQQSYPHALWIAEKAQQNPVISGECCE